MVAGRTGVHNLEGNGRYGSMHRQKYSSGNATAGGAGGGRWWCETGSR